MKCQACDSENDDRQRLCTECGAELIGQGSIVADRYEVLETLGEGGMGTVYLAHDRFLDEQVALKMLHASFAGTAEALARFRSEIKLARKVTHKNVCRIHEYAEYGGLRFLSMEVITGANLKDVVRGTSGLPVAEVADIGIQVATGLQAIHDRGIIHRDLKTANIMRGDGGEVRLVDFGIAKHDSDTEEEGLTAAGDALGTPEYMSPEQARGHKLEFQSDLYSLGIVLFEVTTGELPFKGDSALDTLIQQIQAPPPIERVPALLRPIVAKALAKDVAERYASARGIAADLRVVVQQVSEEGVEETVDAEDLVLPIAGKAPVAPRPPERGDAEITTRGLPTFVWPPGTPPPVGKKPRESPEESRPLSIRVLGLIRELGDAEPKVRWRAAIGLLGVGAGAEEAIEDLEKACADPDKSVADAAATAYRKIAGIEPPPVLPPIEKPPERDTRIALLIDALSGDDDQKRWQAVLALGAMGEGASEAAEPLRDALDDQDGNVRWAAAQAIGQLGVAAEIAVPSLAAALSESDDVLKRNAAQSLGRLGTVAKDAVPGLIGALREEEITIRDEIRDTLVKIGPAAVPSLMEALQDENPQIRFEAADALTKIGIGADSASAS